jgi:tetratricopeptide (TPR) repeat protein
LTKSRPTFFKSRTRFRRKSRQLYYRSSRRREAPVIESAALTLGRLSKAYLRGVITGALTLEVGLAKALESFKKAIKHDPDYALAYTGIADYYNWLGVFAFAPFAETSAAAKPERCESVELDSTSAEAYSALGFATVCHDLRLGRSRKASIVARSRSITTTPPLITGTPSIV